MANIITLPKLARGAPRPLVRLDLHREPLSLMVDWQSAVVAECRRHGSLNPSIFGYLKSSGLLSRCVFLSSDSAGDALRFRFFSAATVATLGRAWARQNLGQPHEDNPHRDFPASLSNEYTEAVDGGEVLFNRLTLHGTTAEPKPYSHVLIGWRAADGRRAVLSVIDD